MAGLAAVAGCANGDGPGDGNGKKTSRDWQPTAGWMPVSSLLQYPKDQIDSTIGERRSDQLRANFLHMYASGQYAPKDWAADAKKPNKRRIRVELFVHENALGAGKTFQQWHSGRSINDLGEKAFMDESAVYFLRDLTLVRLVPRNFVPEVREGQENADPAAVAAERSHAASSAIEVGKSIDDWLQGN